MSKGMWCGLAEVHIADHLSSLIKIEFFEGLSEEISELRAIQKVLGASIPVASGKPWVDFDAETNTRKNPKSRIKSRWNRKKFGGSSKKKNSFGSPQTSHRGRSGKAALVA